VSDHEDAAKVAATEEDTRRIGTLAVRAMEVADGRLVANLALVIEFADDPLRRDPLAIVDGRVPRIVADGLAAKRAAEPDEAAEE
jgi:hypothetical protein